MQFLRAGDTPEMLKGIDPKLMPYTQICDTTSATPLDPYCMPGDGIVPLAELLDILPAGLPLSLEYHHRDQRYTPLAWATHVLDGMEAWATHLAYLDHGVMRLMQPLSEVTELEVLRKGGSSAPLLRLIEGWLRRDAR